VCHDPVEPERLLADPLMQFCLAHLTAQQQQALEQDLEMAMRIQASLLPRKDPRTDGWECELLLSTAWTDVSGIRSGGVAADVSSACYFSQPAFGGDADRHTAGCAATHMPTAR
jgi:hypothetical protein